MSKIEEGERKASEATPYVDLDQILVEEVGQFGRYQLITLALASFPIIFSAFASGEYIFTTSRIPSRCLIPECEASPPRFDADWALLAIPPDANNNTFDACSRYNRTSIPPPTTDTCPAELFDQEATTNCGGEFVYENTYSVVYDFNMACDEWRRSQIGSIRTIGTLLVLPITGYISDRWGRRVALVINALNTGWIGLVRSFVNSYEWFLALEVLESTVGAGAFSSCYILDLPILSMILYLLGKYSIAMVMTSLYVYTAELFPTKYRHSLFAFSSMVGRLGSITAPLTPAFAQEVWEPFPSVLFGSFALVSGLLLFTTPETLGTKLPDTMEEAEQLSGKPST